VQKKTDSESVDILGEFGQGESVGELDAITGSRRTDTVQAIRETEIVRMPAALFDAISVRHPETTLQFMRVIANKVRSAGGAEHAAIHRHSNTANELRPDRNLKTVCILGSNRQVPVAKFASKLKSSLEDLGSTTSSLDLATVMRKLGRHAFTRMGWVSGQCDIELTHQLVEDCRMACRPGGELDRRYRANGFQQNFNIVLYVVDTPPSSQWTLTSIRQADLVLVLGMGDDPSLGEYGGC
jgi:lysophospholipid hydrolase